jgi:hypothetical protein
VAEALSGCWPAQVHAIMVGPDVLLVALDQLPVRTRPPGLGPPIPLQCRQHPVTPCHGQHRKRGLRQNRRACAFSVEITRLTSYGWR